MHCVAINCCIHAALLEIDKSVGKDLVVTVASHGEDHQGMSTSNMCVVLCQIW